MDPRFDRQRDLGRRAFLRAGFAAAATFLGLGLPSIGCRERSGLATPPPGGPATPVGPSVPPPTPPLVSDIANLGPLGSADPNGVRLPAGFTSRIVARSGFAPLPGGSTLWHAAPDGGACFATPDGGWIYVSNAEVGSGGGGVRALRFDANGALLDCYPILAGTSRNCAGGRTPAGTWLSCEEDGDRSRVHECDPFGVVAAAARPALGRFNHEAVAWEALEGRLYLTEDRPDGGLYRFTPTAFTAPGIPDFSAGLLEIARVAGGGPEGAVSWLAVLDPSGASTPTRYQSALRTPFNGGEGIVARGGRVHFATKGDNRIWSYDVASSLLVILYDDGTSPSPILTGVDNIEISSDGDLLVAEDGGDMQVIAITPSGAIVPILQVVGHSASEITGPAFDPSHQRLYFSSQRGASGLSTDGVTFEVTGPFYR